MSLKGSKTEENLKAAFAGESQANRRYLYFAQKADVEGYNDVSALFRSTAEGETGHAHGHLEYLEEVGDPATGMPIGGTEDNLKSAVAGETHSTQTCILAWLKMPVMKALMRLRTGWRLWQRLSAHTPTVFRKHWTPWTTSQHPNSSRWHQIDASSLKNRSKSSRSSKSKLYTVNNIFVVSSSKN